MNSYDHIKAMEGYLPRMNSSRTEGWKDNVLVKVEGRNHLRKKRVSIQLCNCEESERVLYKIRQLAQTLI